MIAQVNTNNKNNDKNLAKIPEIVQACGKEVIDQLMEIADNDDDLDDFMQQMQN